MTRFARAKGSKASNERHPEEPTPWHVMKQDMEMANAAKKYGQEQKTKSAKELLNEKDDPYYTVTTGNVNTDWAEFEKPNVTSVKKEKSEHSDDTPKKKEKPKHANDTPKKDEKPEHSDEIPKKKEKKRKSEALSAERKENDKTEQLENGNTETPSKKAVKRQSTEPISTAECGDNVNVKVDAGIPEKKKKKKNRKKKILSPSKISDATNSGSQDIDGVKSDNANEAVAKVEGPTNKLSKRQKRNRKNRIKNGDDAEHIEKTAVGQVVPGTFNIDGNDWNTDVKFGDAKMNNEKPELANSKQDEDDNQQNQSNPQMNTVRKSNNIINNDKNQKKRKPPKIRDDKEHKRRKPAPDVNKVIINGMEVEIVMYDGFPIRREDSERLKDLRQQMVMKGIPKSEIEAAMKLERRKAEKALTRIKKKVCFHCRKAGHNLSDCPDLGKEESATGICFKCGSTEHTHFECKVNKKAEFRFASCFICREQGHIAKQCPDNPRGLYPDGGSCNLCGDVTHLKKDCPDLAVAKEENTMTVNTIADCQLESLDEDGVKQTGDDCKKPKSKIVTF